LVGAPPALLRLAAVFFGGPPVAAKMTGSSCAGVRKRCLPHI
jgi:hypothetical protein